MKAFYKFRSLVKEATCFNSSENPSRINIILTNKYPRFQRSRATETGLSHFHKMVLTFMKMHFPKKNSRIITYRNDKKFRNETFLTSLQHKVDKQRAFHYINGLDAFSKVFTDVSEKHTSHKKALRKPVGFLSKFKSARSSCERRSFFQ